MIYNSVTFQIIYSSDESSNYSDDSNKSHTKSSKMKSQINYSDKSYSDSCYDSNSDYNSD